MNYQKLKQQLGKIKHCPIFYLKKPGCSRSTKLFPVINHLQTSQKYLIISSDPSGDTDKTKGPNIPHSDFSLRFLALIFFGNDTITETVVVFKNYSELNKIYRKHFYWTHYHKCYAQGNPNNFCAKKYLISEIQLFNPQLILSIGSKPVDFLLGKQKLKNRINRILNYNGVPLIASLHPSKNWNLSRRTVFSFTETWRLIRRNIQFDEEDYLFLHCFKEFKL